MIMLKNYIYYISGYIISFILWNLSVKALAKSSISQTNIFSYSFIIILGAGTVFFILYILWLCIRIQSYKEPFKWYILGVSGLLSVPFFFLVTEITFILGCGFMNLFAPPFIVAEIAYLYCKKSLLQTKNSSGLKDSEQPKN